MLKLLLALLVTVVHSQAVSCPAECELVDGVCYNQCPLPLIANGNSCTGAGRAQQLGILRPRC